MGAVLDFCCVQMGGDGVADGTGGDEATDEASTLGGGTIWPMGAVCAAGGDDLEAPVSTTGVRYSGAEA